MPSQLERLRLLLKDRGILRSGQGQTLRDARGHTVPWMFYSWNISLTGGGLELAGRCLLGRLKRRFRTTQLATLGLTGLPLLSSCLVAGGEDYTGLCIREQRKLHGSGRRLEGPVDRSRPVVLVDDSIASGQTTLKAIEALEEEGLVVEGCLALVSFPYGGRKRVESLGYRLEVLFDVYQDLEVSRPRWPGPALPDRLGPALPSGLDPAAAARQAARAWLTGPMPPGPPERLDHPYDARGGTFISLRRRTDDSRRGRGGFWHFEPEKSDPFRDLVLATQLALSSADPPITVAELDDLKMAVTFCGPLERIHPGLLSFPTHGIVVRSRIFPSKMGGALPNTQVFTNEGEQYYQARVRNAGIWELEPHDLFRHTLTKHVEAGESWLSYGMPIRAEDRWPRDRELGQRLIERARVILEGLRQPEAERRDMGGDRLSDQLLPAPVYGVGVSLYQGGLRGTGLTWQSGLDDCLQRAVWLAWTESCRDVVDGPVSLSVALLHSPEWLGASSWELAAVKLRLGLDSLAVEQGELNGIMLAAQPVWNSLSKAEAAQRLLQSAGLTAQGSCWSTFQTAYWLDQPCHGLSVLSMGFPERSASPDDWRRDLALVAEAICRRCGGDGLPDYQVWPVSGQRQPEGPLPDRLLAVLALSQAGNLLQRDDWRQCARQGFETARLQANDGLSWSLLVATAAELGLPPQPQWLESLNGMRRKDGRIAPTGQGLREVDHDLQPGLILLALARAGQSPASLRHHLDWYERRFGILKSWSMVGWQARAWGELWRQTPDPGMSRFVFAMADWALEIQHQASGAFILDQPPHGFSFHSAYLAAAVAEAWGIARHLGRRSRSRRYAQAYAKALSFLTRLIIHPEDTFCMSDAEAVGGVRVSLTSTEARSDGAGYVLQALVAGWRSANIAVS